MYQLYFIIPSRVSRYYSADAISSVWAGNWKVCISLGRIRQCGAMQSLYDIARPTINTLRPGQSGHDYTDDNFKCIFMNENVWILKLHWETSVPKGPIDSITAFVQILAWRRPGDKPKSEPMFALVGDAYVRRSASINWSAYVCGWSCSGESRRCSSI